MPSSSKGYRGQISIFYILILFSNLPVSASSRTVVSSSSTVSTCPFRTVNYITHSLPQQCLATARILNSTATLPSESKSNDVIATQIANALDQNSKVEDITTDLSAIPASTTAIPTKVIPKTETALPNSVAKDNPSVIDVDEEDSALESGNFLSFEEWKKQNLKKAGQSEHLGQKHQGDIPDARRRPAVQNSLDTLGEDGEIDIDFSGFVPGGPEQLGLELVQPSPEPSSSDQSAVVPSTPQTNKRNKDAGTTGKERFNYASFDCAANMLKSNKGAKNIHSVLLENKDSYMLNQCALPDKFLILELCEYILIDTIVLANYEFFSSTFRTFRVSVSDRWPVKTEKWKILGTYEARNTRQVQAFLVENPLIWARYLRIEFLTHYGNEYYCPISLVRVHGITMMQEWKSGDDSSQDNDNEEIDAAQSDDALVQSSVPIIAADQPDVVFASQETPGVEELATPVDSLTFIEETLQIDSTSSSTTASLPPSVVAMEAIMSVIESSDTCVPAEKPTQHSTSQIESSSHQAHLKEPSPALSAATPETTTRTNTTRSASIPDSVTSSTFKIADSQKTVPDHSWHGDATLRPSSQTVSKAASNKAKKEQSGSASSVAGDSKSKASGSSTVAERPKSSSTAISAYPAVPTTQESFFKSVQKRLQMLEANSSLSLQYIEDQSRALRDAFKKVEQRQLSRTTNFLEQLNQTVLQELKDFRQQYDQLWQSTVIELELQRERYQRDNEAIHAKISILADEVVFQRRMAVLQMILILVCLVLVLFSRGVINNYLELPLVQNVLGRSPNARWLNLSTDSISRPSMPVRTRSAQQLRIERTNVAKGHQRMQSEDSITDVQSGNEVYAPPTPISDYGQSEVDLPGNDTNSPLTKVDYEPQYNDLHFDPSQIERPATSPPTLTVSNAEDNVPEAVETSEEEQPTSTNVSLEPLDLQDGQTLSDLLSPESIAPARRLSWKLPDTAR